MEAFNSISEYFVEYMENKSILKPMLNYIASNPEPTDEVIYRGDCLYESKIFVGSTIKLWNTVASFTTDIGVAEKFSNDKHAPDWYYDEYEWIGKEEYPFKDSIANNEKLKPIIFVVKPNAYIKGVFTEKYSDRFNESEYVILTDDIEFCIDRIEGEFLYCSVYSSPRNSRSKTDKLNLFR